MPRHCRSVAAAVVATGIFLLSASWVAAADYTRQPARFPVLRAIMHDMGRNMQVIAGAVSREDWERVAKTAPLLAERPQPSMAEKFRLLGFLGSNAGEFRAYDKQTRYAAQALELAATRGNGKASIAAFSRLEASCLGCHRDFRKSFVERSDENRDLAQ